MIPMIIDTDPGVDDAMAIAYALSHPDIELLALTTVFGNTHLEATTRNACWLLDQFGAASVDVARGAALPMAQGPLPHAEFVHGADGVGNAYPSEPVVLNPSARHARIQESSAAEYIVSAARARPGEIALVAIGPLTNIAAALALEPSLPSLVHSLVIMGGTLDEPGNVSPAAEANFFNDPHAGDSILAADWPATLVGLDVTQGTEPCCAMHDAAAVALCHGACSRGPGWHGVGTASVGQKRLRLCNSLVGGPAGNCRMHGC